jgi:inosine triphosphate pyrophosphatase
MSKPSIIFVTGNKNKLKEVQAILGEYLTVESEQIDLPELQGETCEEIAIEKCKLAALEAAKSHGKPVPVICEDTSLGFNALKGLPGPYIKWFLHSIGHEGLNNLLHAYEDKRIVATCVFTYCEGPGIEPIVFRGDTPGKLVKARGPTDFGWDPVFQPDGFDQTYAEMDKEVKNKISHRSRALAKLLAHLKK